MSQKSVSETIMSMSDETWLRHANPWSGWTRMSALPLVAIAVWSREWIGWYSAFAVGGVILWIWLNPRLFPLPKDTNNWMSKGVQGERFFLARKDYQVSNDHVRVAHILSGISAFGMLPFAYGLWVLDIWIIAFGMSVTMLAKLWFLDRMVWIRADVFAMSTNEEALPGLDR